MKDKSSETTFTSSNGQSSSIINVYNVGDYSQNFVQRSPLSDISNVNNSNIVYNNAFQARKARKLYLDSKRSKLKPSSSNADLHKSINENITPESSRGRFTISSNMVTSVGTSGFNHNVSLSSLSKGKCNLLSNVRDICPVPMFDLTSDEPAYVDNQELHKSINDNITPESNCRRFTISSNLVTSAGTSTSTDIHTLNRLSKGKRKLISNVRDISPVPMFDLTSDEPVSVKQIVKDPFVGISKDYVDHGDQTVICQVCNAKLWKSESRCHRKYNGKTTYMLCCSYGKVLLPELKPANSNYQNLFRCLDSKSKFFMQNIRRYNSMFSFTSMGGKIDSSVNKGRGPYVFRLSGQNYHTMGSLLPQDGCRPQFAQLYIYDTSNEVANRQNIFSESTNQRTSLTASLDEQLIEEIKVMLDTDNALVNVYRMVRDAFNQNPTVDLKLRLIGHRKQDGRTYNTPIASEVAALIVGDFADAIDNRDIIVTTQTGELQRISELHPAYLALQYPLLFPYGDDGYRVDILHRDVLPSQNKKRTNCTMREFFAYRIQDRNMNFSLILNAKRLFQQFIVDGYTMIESERLYYIRNQQTKLRCESFENIHKLQNSGHSTVSNIGQRVILPSSFTGGARYMMQNYLDAMALCKWFGYPDFFITFTCNSNWPEIKRFLKDKTINADDRPDILCRLFKIKLDAMMKDLTENALLGKVSAVVYTIEFQKRGLPHAHICLFMHVDHKLPTAEHIDRFISAEIPDENEDPELYSLVCDLMIHGPCGDANPNCPCMVDRKCSKRFPKKFSSYTSVDEDGFPVYRRRDFKRTVEKSGVNLDNRSVVPYNKQLLKKYQAHINVEWCNQAGSIKYLFKYINKGPDRATVAVIRDNKEHNETVEKDEINEYYDCRYLSACEAAWRIFSFDVHYRQPSVIRLPFHLPGQQQIVYAEYENIDNILNKPSIASTMFLSWMDCNKKYPLARQLTYVEFPTKFVWKIEKRCWEPRKQGFSIGRIHVISPSVGEAYFLRVLLNKVKGPQSFDDIKTFNGQTFSTFRDTCYAMGLLDDDNEYVEAIKEASHSGSGFYLRSLFATMLMTDTLSRPDFVWENTWTYLSDDILYHQRKKMKFPGFSLIDDQIKNLTLMEIENYLLRNNSSLTRFSSMPYPDSDSLASSNNRLINEELSYDINTSANECQSLINSLTIEQRYVFEDIMKAVETNNGGVFFVYGYGGTGKTFLWKTLSSTIRSKGQIVLNVASSGIASLLLSGGRTAHSRFHIPINLTEDSMCYIKPGTDDAHLLKETKLIIWDEAPMTHKHAFEALDRTMRDILFSPGSNYEKPFGGKAIVFGGDFRQILPVIQNGSRQQIVNASLSSSYIWSKCKLLTLTKNMRLSTGSDAHDLEKTKEFANWLLELGEGKIGEFNDGESTIEIPDDLLFGETVEPISTLVEFVYPSIFQNYKNPGFFSERSILAPTNEYVQEINDHLLSQFPGEEIVYLSSDTICQTESLNGPLEESLYAPDVLNGLKISGLPNHKLILKVGVPVMLLRNIDLQNGLCNGTRLQIVSLGNRVIEAEIISGANIGTRTFIPRINMIPSDKRIPFKFQRRQFPVSVCFAMSINKSQGQSLSRVGLYLKEPVFSHGQLYVAISRIKSRDGIKLLILDKDGRRTNKTKNVVYKEVFTNL